MAKIKTPLICNQFEVKVKETGLIALSRLEIESKRLAFWIIPTTTDQIQVELQFKQVKEYTWFQRILLNLFFR